MELGWTCPDCGYRIEGPVALPVACVCGIRHQKPTPHVWPAWTHLVKPFRKPQDVGIGDTFEHMAAAVGAKKTADFLHKYGIDCGCGDRKAKWNRLYSY